MTANGETYQDEQKAPQHPSSASKLRRVELHHPTLWHAVIIMDVCAGNVPDERRKSDQRRSDMDDVRGQEDFEAFCKWVSLRH